MRLLLLLLLFVLSSDSENSETMCPLLEDKVRCRGLDRFEVVLDLENKPVRLDKTLGIFSGGDVPRRETFASDSLRALLVVGWDGEVLDRKKDVKRPDKVLEAAAAGAAEAIPV